MSIFDGLSKATFTTVENIIGDVALWTPSNNLVEQSEKVLFKKPDVNILLGDSDKYTYDPYDYSFEYYEGQFSGLKASVDNGNMEKVTINGIDLDVIEVKTIVDGRNYKASCTLHVEPVLINVNPVIG